MAPNSANNQHNSTKELNGTSIIESDCCKIHCTGSIRFDSPRCKNHFECIFDSNPLISLFIRPGTGEIVDANEAASRFYGYSMEELKKMKITDLNMLSKEQIFNKMISVLENRDTNIKSKSFSFQHRIRSGEIKDVEVHSCKFDLFGEELLFSQIVDVSLRKEAERKLKDSEDRFRSIVELSPNAIVVCQDNRIVFANKNAIELLRLKKPEDVLKKSVLDFVKADRRDIALAKLREVSLGRAKVHKIEAKLVADDGENIEVEINASYINFKGKNSIQAIIENVTEEKRDINRALTIQANSLEKYFPLKDKAILNYLWIPAIGVSGDFYCFHKVSDQKVVGLIGDVSGKGISAALSVSAIKVMFHDAIDLTDRPDEVLKYINDVLPSHLQEDYVAACCFVIDFSFGSVEVVGAGISEFIHSRSDGAWEKFYVEGPFLGMFKDGEFESISISFNKGDRLFFYTDGLNEIFDRRMIVDEMLNMDSEDCIKNISDIVYNQLSYKDDCTCIVIDFTNEE